VTTHMHDGSQVRQPLTGSSNRSRYALKSPVQAAEERMLKGLRGLCEKAKPLPRMLTAHSCESSERGEPRCDVDPLKSLSASSARLMTIDAYETMLALLE
jgi:hypothetical protein